MNVKTSLRSLAVAGDRFVLPKEGEILLYRMIDAGEECTGLDEARKDGVNFRTNVFSVDAKDVEFYEESGYLFVTEDYTGMIYLLKNPLLVCIGQKGLSNE